jgi:integrase
MARLRHNGATQEMQKDMYLYRRSNGIWYFRRRVPTYLAGIIQTKQFHYSLRTKSKSDAILQLSAELAKSEHLIRKERQRLTQAPVPLQPLAWRRRRIEAERAKRRRSRVFCQYTDADIHRVVSTWLHNAARETENTYRNSFAMNDPEQREEIEQDIDHEWRCLRGEFPGDDDLLVSRAVRAILDQEDCDPPREWCTDPLFRKFYALVLQGLLQLNQISKSLVTTGMLPDRSRLNGIVADTGARGVGNGATADSITLDELIERFDKCPRRQHLRQATRAEYALIYRVLREHIGGSTPIADIRRPAILEVAETLRHVPSRATLKAPKIPLRQLAADAQSRGLPQPPAKTYNKKVQQISALFSYAVTEQLFSHNPATKLSVPEPLKTGEDKGFSADELNTIFAGDFFTQFFAQPGAQFVPDHPLRPCYFWTPLIALFQGFRSGEILQLRTANVRERNGVIAIKIEGNVKNQQTIRWVPMHPKLRELGFLRYVENARRAGHERLFPDAKLACDGKYSTWFQKPWANYLKRIGVKQSRDECFHSFRHTWVGALRRADVPEEIRKRLGGWKIHGAEAGYGSEHLPRLLKYLRKVDYPDLDLKRFSTKPMRTTSRQ